MPVMKNMKKNLLIFALIAIFFSACDWGSVNSLSPQSQAELDTKLEGTWTAENTTLEITKNTKNTMMAHIENLSVSEMEIPFFITRGPKHNYFNIRYEDTIPSLDSDAYFFVKYSIIDDSLVLFLFDSEPIKSAVKSKTLKGETVYQDAEHTQEAAIITDTSENMVKFFEEQADNLIEPSIRFTRVK
jgi:hypothetical protein